MCRHGDREQELVAIFRAFSRRFYPKRLTAVHPFTHRGRSQPRKAAASSSGALRVRCHAQGHLDTQLGGPRDRTSHLPVTGQLAVPPILSRVGAPRVGGGGVGVVLRSVIGTDVTSKGRIVWCCGSRRFWGQVPEHASVLLLDDMDQNPLEVSLHITASTTAPHCMYRTSNVSTLT